MTSTEEEGEKEMKGKIFAIFAVFAMVFMGFAAIGAQAEVTAQATPSPGQPALPEQANQVLVSTYDSDGRHCTVFRNGEDVIIKVNTNIAVHDSHLRLFAGSKYLYSDIYTDQDGEIMVTVTDSCDNVVATFSAWIESGAVDAEFTWSGYAEDAVPTGQYKAYAEVWTITTTTIEHYDIDFSSYYDYNLVVVGPNGEIYDPNTATLIRPIKSTWTSTTYIGDGTAVFNILW